MNKMDIAKRIVLLICVMLIKPVFAEPWPVAPQNTQHPVAGTTGEYRNVSRYHRGVDITDGPGIYSMAAGTLTSGGSGFWTDYVSVGGILYFHVSPDLPDGQYVAQGVRIATMETGGPVHVHIQRPGTNFLDGVLDPFTDNTAPTIHSHYFRRDPHNVSTTGQLLTESDLWGKVDIEVRADDTRLTSAGNDPGVGAVAPYSVTYELRNHDGSTVIEAVNNIVFTQYPANNASAADVFGVNSTDTVFNWVVTNHPFDLPYNRYWNTEGRSSANENWTGNANLDAREINEARYRDGAYQVRVIARDTQPNEVDEIYDVIVNNFKPYVKQIEIGAEPKYKVSWNYDDQNNSMSVLKSKNDFFGPGTHQISVEFSEPVRDTPTFEIAGFSTGLTALASTEAVNNRKTWTATLSISASDNSHDGEQQVTIRDVHDISGNVGELLDGQPGSIAIKDANGLFLDNNDGGNVDINHKILIDTKAPTSSLLVKP